MTRRFALMAALALVVALTGTARAIDPGSGFGPTPIGCPVFWEVDGRPQGGDIDPPVGPFGTSQIHVTGFGFDIEGEDISMTIRVANMQRRTAPGSSGDYWSANLWPWIFRADYSVVSDTFTYRLINGATFDRGPATGNVVLGPGGGLTITAKLADLQVPPHSEAETTRAGGGMWFGHEDAHFAEAPWSGATGPELVPLVPCPGLSLHASRDRGVKEQVFASGITLPMAGGQAVELQVLSEGQWTTVATGTSEDDGGYGMSGTLPPGPAMVRATVATEAGIGTSAPVKV